METGKPEEIRLQEANKRLLARREELKATEPPGQLTSNTEYFENIAKRCREMGLENHRPEIVFDDDDRPREESWPLRHVGVPGLYGACTFDTYLGNDKLVNRLKKSIDDGGDVVLRGNTGCGKTHLGVAMMRGEMEHDALFITVPDLLLKIRASFNGEGTTEDAIIREYAEIPLLMLDDMGAEKSTEFSITTLYIILDRRIRDCRRTIITTNLSKEEIEKTFGARIASRLAGMENIKINMPDRRRAVPAG
jgi:DNA replication protein DnaC